MSTTIKYSFYNGFCMRVMWVAEISVPNHIEIKIVEGELGFREDPMETIRNDIAPRYWHHDTDSREGRKKLKVNLLERAGELEERAKVLRVIARACDNRKVVVTEPGD